MSKITKATHGAGRYKDSDEKYTAHYAVEPILEFIPIDLTVWCPMDTEESEFVKQLRARGNKVIATHIETGQDFFRYEPDEHWDYILSNPPFTNKAEFYRRAISFGKPFMFLMAVDPLSDDTITAPFREAGVQMQMLHLGNRVSYIDNNGNFQLNRKGGCRPSFGSAYIGMGILPRDIVLRQIPPCNKISTAARKYR